MKTLFILPILWLLTVVSIPERRSYGEIIIDNIPAWQPVSVSGDYRVEIMVPELTSDFIANHNIKISANFRGIEGFKVLPFIDNLSAARHGTYDYSLEPLKLTCTFSPIAKGRADGSSVCPMLFISFNYN